MERAKRQTQREVFIVCEQLGGMDVRAGRSITTVLRGQRAACFCGVGVVEVVGLWVAEKDTCPWRSAMLIAHVSDKRRFYFEDQTTLIEEAINFLLGPRIEVSRRYALLPEVK